MKRNAHSEFLFGRTQKTPEITGVLFMRTLSNVIRRHSERSEESKICYQT